MKSDIELKTDFENHLSEIRYRLKVAIEHVRPETLFTLLQIVIMAKKKDCTDE